MRIPFLLIITLFTINLFAQEDKTLWTVAWSPDDKRIAIGGNQGDLKIFDGQTYELIKTYPVKDVILSRLKWHPRQNKLAVITQSESFKTKILDLDSEEWLELENLKNSIRGIDWNHNGALLALSEFGGEISIYNLEGKRVSRFMADPKSITGLDWHPEKNIIAGVGSKISAFTMQGDTLLHFEPRNEEVFFLCVEWHPSGDFFATGDYGTLEKAENKRIQFWNLKGEKLNDFGKGDAEYRNIRWSSDGQYLASANDALRIWDAKGQLISETKSSKDYLWGVDWNSDNTFIITTSSEGVISLWDKDLKFIQHLNY